MLWVLYFTKNMGKNIIKDIGKNVTGSYSPGMLAMHQIHAKQSATDAFKTASKRTIQKTAEAAGDLIDNKIARKTKKLQNLQQNNSKAVTNEHEKQIPKKIYISQKKDKKLLMI